MANETVNPVDRQTLKHDAKTVTGRIDRAIAILSASCGSAELHDAEPVVEAGDRVIDIMLVSRESAELFDGPKKASEPTCNGDCDHLVWDNQGEKWHIRVANLPSSDTSEPRPHGRTGLVCFNGWTYRISEVRVVTEIPGVEPPEHSYLVFILDAVNRTNDWNVFFSNNKYAEVLLIDVGRDAGYLFDFDATRAYGQEMGYGRSMKWIVAPREERRVPLVFDVPAGDGPFVLSTQMIGEKISPAITMTR